MLRKFSIHHFLLGLCFQVWIIHWYEHMQVNYYIDDLLRFLSTLIGFSLTITLI